jgi:hypothetical protein
MIASEKNSAKKAHLLEYLNDLENVQVTQNAQNQAPRNAQ